MTNTTPLLDDLPWSPSLALRVEQVCNRFEAAHKAGQRPQIECYLGQTPDPERLVLLRELLGVDLEYRRKRGEEVTPQEYCRQFAEYAVLISDLVGGAPRTTHSALPPGRARTSAPGDQPPPPAPGYQVPGRVG